MTSFDPLAHRVRVLPQQLAHARQKVAALEGRVDKRKMVAAALMRWRARVADLEAEAREYRFFDLLQAPAEPASPQDDDTMPDTGWVLDLHLDTKLKCVMVTATDRAEKVTHREPVIRLTVPGVREAVERLVCRHGAPDRIMTDHAPLWDGLGAAIGASHWCPEARTSDAWMRRFARVSA